MTSHFNVPTDHENKRAKFLALVALRAASAAEGAVLKAIDDEHGKKFAERVRFELRTLKENKF